MPAPSPLVIATSVHNRYVKEEKSYHQELEQQSARIAKLEAGGSLAAKACTASRSSGWNLSAGRCCSR